jgi:hypothetical protein
LAIILLFPLLGPVLRCLSRPRLVGMVLGAGETDRTCFGSGCRIGQSRCLSLLGIDLALGIPAVVVSVLLVAIGRTPLVLLATHKHMLTILVGVLTAPFMPVMTSGLIPVETALSVLGEMADRQPVPQGKGWFDSIQDGYQLPRENLRHAGLVWPFLSILSLVFRAAESPACGRPGLSI